MSKRILTPGNPTFIGASILEAADLDHSALTGVTSDQHHAQLHAAAHASGQGDELSVTALADYDPLPVGLIIPYGGSSAPNSTWLMCDGSEVSRSTYSDLFAAIGTTFGVGNGSSTFNLPDMRGRFPLGEAVSGTGSAIGGVFGSLDHTHSGPSHAHTMPTHSHDVNIPSFTSGGGSAHNHANQGAAVVGAELPSSGSSGLLSQSDTGSATKAHAHDHSGNVANESGHTHSIDPPNRTSTAVDPGDTNAGGTASTGTSNPPTLVVNYLIKAL